MVSKLVDIGFSAFNPEYNDAKAKLKQVANDTRGKGIGLIVGGVAAIVGGIALCIFTAGIGAFVGGGLIGAGVGMLYLGYNFKRLSENLSDYAENPLKYNEFFGLGSLDKESFRAQMSKNTFLFDHIINQMVDASDPPTPQMPAYI